MEGVRYQLGTGEKESSAWLSKFEALEDNRSAAQLLVHRYKDTEHFAEGQAKRGNRGFQEMGDMSSFSSNQGCPTPNDSL